MCVGDGTSVSCYPLGAPKRGRVVLTGLADWPVPLARGRAGIRLNAADGTTTRIVDFTNGLPRVLFSAPVAVAPAFSYVPSWTPEVVTVDPFGGRSLTVCLSGGSTAEIPSGALRLTHGALFVSIDRTPRVVDGLFLLEARAWRASAACH